MQTHPEDQYSLWAALQRGREEPDRHTGSKKHFDTVHAKFLEGERVLFAMEGNGWTFVDPLVAATDRRIVFLTRGLFTPWRMKAEFPASSVTGATLKPALLFGKVTVHTRGGESRKIRYNKEVEAQQFVQQLNRLISGR